MSIKTNRGCNIQRKRTRSKTTKSKHLKKSWPKIKDSFDKGCRPQPLAVSCPPRKEPLAVSCPPRKEPLKTTSTNFSRVKTSVGTDPKGTHKSLEEAFCAADKNNSGSLDKVEQLGFDKAANKIVHDFKSRGAGQNKRIVSERKSLVKAFLKDKSLDPDNDGLINGREQALGTKKQQLEQAFKESDLNQDGKVDSKERYDFDKAANKIVHDFKTTNPKDDSVIINRNQKIVDSFKADRVFEGKLT